MYGFSFPSEYWFLIISKISICVIVHVSIKIFYWFFDSLCNLLWSYLSLPSTLSDPPSLLYPPNFRYFFPSYPVQIVLPFLMTYCYSHRLMHFSVLIGDTSVCSRLWLTWRPTTGKVQRIRSSAVNRASVSHALLPRLRDHCGRVVRKKDHKSHGQWITQWNISSSGYTGQLHIQSHECYDSMHEIFKRSSQIKTQHEVERWTWRPTPWWGDIGNYFQIIKILIVAWKGESVSLRMLLLVSWLHFSGRPHMSLLTI